MILLTPMIHREEMQQVEGAQYAEIAETIERVKAVHRRYWNFAGEEGYHASLDTRQT